jgi:hypothetical protein
MNMKEKAFPRVLDNKKERLDKYSVFAMINLAKTPAPIFG